MYLQLKLQVEELMVNMKNKSLWNLVYLISILSLMSACTSSYMVSGGESSSHADKDYKIKHAVLLKLAKDPDIHAKTIHVRVDHGRVILTGTVKKRWMKRRVKLLVRSVKGVHGIDNRLKFQHH